MIFFAIAVKVVIIILVGAILTCVLCFTCAFESCKKRWKQCFGANKDDRFKEAVYNAALDKKDGKIRRLQKDVIRLTKLVKFKGNKEVDNENVENSSNKIVEDNRTEFNQAQVNAPPAIKIKRKAPQPPIFRRCWSTDTLTAQKKANQDPYHGYKSVLFSDCSLTVSAVIEKSSRNI